MVLSMKQLKSLLFGGFETQNRIGDFGLLLLRLFTGLALSFAHGIGKVPPSEQFIQGVGDLGFPIPHVFAWCAAFAEFFGGMLLAIGLFTRPSAFLIAVTMGVAAFVVHAADPFQRKEMALLFLFIALAFLFMGSGRYGIDNLIRKSK